MRAVQLNLLPPGYRRRRRTRWMQAAAGTALCGIVTAAAFWIWTQRQELEAWQNRAAQAPVDAAAMRQAQAELARLRAEQTELQRRQAYLGALARPVWSVLLDDLARVAPSQAVLEEISRQGNQLVLRGLAPDLSTVAELEQELRGLAWAGAVQTELLEGPLPPKVRFFVRVTLRRSPGRT